MYGRQSLLPLKIPRVLLLVQLAQCDVTSLKGSVNFRIKYIHFYGDGVRLKMARYDTYLCFCIKLIYFGPLLTTYTHHDQPSAP
jgi:hypothetical protein